MQKDSMPFSSLNNYKEFVCLERQSFYHILYTEDIHRKFTDIFDHPTNLFPIRPASTDFTGTGEYNRFNSIGKAYQNEDVKV